MAEVLRPLRPRVCLRVGVTGHRPGPKLPAESLAPLRQTVDRVLAAVASSARNVIAASSNDGLIDAALELTVVSALAEGADRIVADAGMAAGFGLDAVLPFAREEYARDFKSEAAGAAFESLLGLAASVFELDGDRKQFERAYEAAGIVTLANCDLLIAIWDQSEAAGLGGTAFIVERAVNERIPVVLINPAQPARAGLLWAGDDALMPASVRKEDLQLREAFIEMQGVVDTLIAPPSGTARANLVTYLGERERRWNFGPWYVLLLLVFSGRKMQRGDFELPPYLAATREQWADYLKIVRRDDRLATAIDRNLLPAFAMADKLSVHYARVYRSVYVLNFMAAATVATLAVLGLIMHYRGWTAFLRISETIELILIGMVILSWGIGHRRQWHRRWLEYRRLAECLRHMRLVSLTASIGPMARPGKLPEDETDWVDWYARAIRRLLPLPHQKVSPDYIEMVRAATCEAESRGQIRYHQDNAVLMETLDHRLHTLGYVLFVATAATLAVLLLVPASENLHGVKTFMIVLSVILPIFGSAFSAIRVQGDFATVVRRSQRTANRLTAITQALAGETLTFARLADRVEMASDMMMDDLAEWQLMFRTRPLSLPV